jgi:aminomethyltransferase
VTEAENAPLLTTPLDSLHRELGARMVPFAGYAMPVQYAGGIIAEHTWCRTHASLFDVSHMGQAWLRGSDVAAALETLVPASYKELKAGRTRYTVLTTEQGGILDDLMITHVGPDTWFMVVNAGCKDADFAHIQAAIGDRIEMEILTDRALIAIQGPAAAAAMAHLAPASASMVFMDAGPLDVAGVPCFVTRSGYTGEDGFEISVAADQAEHLARHFLALESVQPCGLGARDSLRLEAGLPLYGADIDTTTSPVEAALGFAIGKRRRSEGGFPGAEVILDHLATGTRRLRVGIALDGRAPARAHTEIQDTQGRTIGEVTSGGFAPSLSAPIAMGYVETAFAEPGTPLHLIVRGKALEGRVVAMPFVEQRYYRG